MPTYESWIYTAGIVDGEGCIRLTKDMRIGRRVPSYTLSVSIAQNSKKFLEDLQQEINMTGGISTNTNAYSLSYSGDNACKFLNKILPYLRIKREQALLALDYCRELRRSPGRRISVDDAGSREMAYQHLKDLKRMEVL